MAQIKKVDKFQSGGTVTPKYKFKVDNNDFEVDDSALDSSFDTAFQKLVDSGYARKNDREAWNQRYQAWKNQAKDGVYNIDMQGNNVGSVTYTGGQLSNENAGLNKKGESAKSNFIGRLIGGVDDGDKQMSLLNGLLSESIGKGALNKFAEDKVKLEQDEKKKKDEKLASNKEFVNKYKLYNDVGTSLYGNEGDSNWRLSEYWKEKKGQTGKYSQALNNLFSHVTDSRYDDEEMQKLFKESTGKDINELRGYLKDFGYVNDGSFQKNFDFKKTYDLRNKFDILASHQPYLDREAYEKAKTAAAQAASGASGAIVGGNGTTPSSTEDTSEETPFSGVRDKRLYRDGKKYTGVNIGDLNDEFSWEDPLTGFYVDGAKATSKADFEKHLQKLNDPNQIKAYQDRMNEINQKRTAAFSRMAPLSSFNAQNTGSNYAFKDLLDKGKQPEAAEEISGLFTKYANNPNIRIYQYKVNGKDRLEGSGLIRHRIVQNDNRYDGIIKKGIDGTYYLQQSNGKRRILGAADGNNSKQRENPFYLEEGGKIKKAQLGGLLNQSKPTEQSTKFRAASNNNLYKAATDKNYKLSSADKWELGSLMADVAGLGLSATGVGSVGAGVAGVGGTVANFVSNVKRDGLDWDDVGEGVLGLGLDAATFIPGLGLAGKTGKVLNGLRKASKWLGGAMAAAGATAAVGSLAKINDPSKMTIDDWKNITVGLQSVLSGKRMLDSTIGTKNTMLNTVKANGKDYHIDSTGMAAIKGAKTTDEKVKAAKQAILNSQMGKNEKLTVDKINLDLKESKSLLNKAKSVATFGKFGKATTGQVQTESNAIGRELRDYSTANWYTKRAIKNVASQNPNVKGADELLGKRYVANTETGTYDKISDWRSGSGFLGNKTRMKGDPSTEGSYKAQTDGLLPKAASKQEVSGEAINHKVAFKGSKEAPTEQVKAGKSALRSTTVSTKSADDKFTQDLRKVFGGKGDTEIKRSINTLFSKVKTPEDANKLGAMLSGNFEAGSRNKEIQTRLQEAFRQFKEGKNGRKFVRLQQGGKIPMFQNAGILNRKPILKAYGNNTAPGDIRPGVNMSNTPIAVQDNTYVHLPGGQAPMFGNKPTLGTGTGLLGAMMKPKAPIPSNAPKVETKPGIAKNPTVNRTVSDKGAILNKPNTIQFPKDNLEEQVLESNKNLPSIKTTVPQSKVATNYKQQILGSTTINNSNNGGFKFKPDLQTASELARALFIRNNNKNLDYKVKPAILEHVLEVPNQVRGDLYAKSAFDKQANQFVTSAGRPTTSDGMLQTAKMLSVNQQADQIRGQGIAADVDALNRSRILSEQMNQSYAQGRQAVANQNIQSMAAADEANRQNRNIKAQAMNQPIDAFWAAQNQKMAMNEQQNKMYDRELQKLNITGTTAPMIKNLQTQMSNLQTQIDLDKGRNVATDELEKQYQGLQDQSNQFQVKQQFANLHLARNPNMTIDPSFFNYTQGWTPQMGFGNINSTANNSMPAIGVKKKGGVIDLMKEQEKTKREIMKEKNRANRDLARTYNSWMTNKARMESMEKISASNNVNQIIKLALTSK